jgi:anti-sigma factor NepR-like protein
MDSNGRLKESVALKFQSSGTTSKRGDEQYRQTGLSSESNDGLAGTKRHGRSGGPGKGRGKKADVGTQIGFQLRNLYDDVLNQPVPDRFLDLLSQLETSPGSSLKD